MEYSVSHTARLDSANQPVPLTSAQLDEVNGGVLPALLFAVALTFADAFLYEL